MLELKQIKCAYNIKRYIYQISFFFFSVEFYTPIFQILKSLDTQNIKKEIYTFQISTIES